MKAEGSGLQGSMGVHLPCSHGNAAGSQQPQGGRKIAEISQSEGLVLRAFSLHLHSLWLIGPERKA